MSKKSVSRRSFLQTAGGAAVAAAVASSSSRGFSAVREQLSSRPGSRTGTLFVPAGELRIRIGMTQQRLTKSGVPRFSIPFIIADVSLDPKYPRRFTNYSGDLSGRYIGALAMLPPEEGIGQLDAIVRQALAFQREDGRFGDASLSFAAQDISREQMALLWGNGRLLVGLLEYNAVHPSKEVLGASKRLAEFLLKIQESCSNPDVMHRLVGQGASGFICFTQLIEAFALLGQQTGEREYYDAAGKIIPWLQPRDNQHSHGYLTTLRGIAQLCQATGNADQLRYVENAYRDLTSSSDYTIYGGVYEYFSTGPDNVQTQEKGRDEGCSEADFVRLSLQLWKATGRIEYFERAERCLLNEFFFNQFNTGDFGHHTSFRYGYRPTESVGRAWWCCTMHGLRAFRDVMDAVVTAEDDLVKINLFLDGTWSRDRVSLEMKDIQAVGPGSRASFRIAVRDSLSWEGSIAVRQPDWASAYTLRLNGGPAESRSIDGYSVVRRRWEKGDVLDVGFDYRLRCLTRSGKFFDFREVGEKPEEAALFCGPWLLAADSGSEPAFFGEPWMGNSPVDSSVILLPGTVNPNDSRAGAGLTRPSAHCRFEYIHGGWPDKHSVTLRPISEQSANEPQTVAVWLRYRRG